LTILIFTALRYSPTQTMPKDFIYQTAIISQEDLKATRKDTFEIVREGSNGVDGHKYLLFHSGNIEKHSEGCILLGETIGKLEGVRAVLNSGATFQKFLFYTKDVKSFSLTLKTAG